MFLNLIHDLQPQYIAVCFDKSKPTIRQAMYAGYHEHRPQMATDFAVQVPVVHHLLEELRVPIFAIDGYEGDDLVGTIATDVQNAKGKGQNGEIETIIVTGDRDLLQLVNDHTRVLMPITGITKTVTFDEKAVEEKYGVTPKQFIDYKALIGDQSDGYPGVTGIGPKTAANLLQEYGTFEALFERIGELPEKTGLKLATDAEQAALAKKLATIMTDVPLQFDLSQCEMEKLDFVTLKEQFQQHGFSSLIKKVDERYPDAVKMKAKKKEDANQLGFLD
jgi:DNA polymerase-1